MLTSSRDGSGRSKALLLGLLVTVILLTITSWPFHVIPSSEHRPATRISPTGLVAPRPIGQEGHDSGDHDLAAPTHVISAWLDTRPVLAARYPEIVILATTLGQPYVHHPINTGAAHRNSNSAFDCVIRSERSRATGQPVVVEHGRTNATLVVLQDQHEYDKKLVTVTYTCQTVKQELVDWQASTLSVALVPEQNEPEARDFVPVYTLPVLDPDTHRTGQGYGAVCLPPLLSDLYAPFLRDYVRYYRALGFTRLYMYLHNPGPRTLDVVRALQGQDDDGSSVVPIRWAMPRAWIRSATLRNASARGFLVDPVDWNLTGVDTLSEVDEAEYGVPNGGKNDVDIWYFGQAAAQQDCALRAMHAGARFVANVDYDEYVSLVLPHDNGWPHARRSDKTPLDRFVSWTRGLDRDSVVQSDLARIAVPPTLSHDVAEWLALDIPALTQGLVPSALVLQSAFSCIKCQPENPPRLDNRDLDAALTNSASTAEWHQLAVTSALPLALLSPVRTEWIALPRRSKAIVDPWAWHSNVVHYPGLGYVDYALSSGPCSGSLSAGFSRNRSQSEQDRECARALLSVLGAGAVAVQPVSVMDTPGLDTGRGGFYHVRVDSTWSRALEPLLEPDGRLSESAVVDVRASTTSSATLRRVAKAEWHTVQSWDWPKSDLVEDWTLARVMSKVLCDGN